MSNCEKCGGITGPFAQKVALTLQMTGQRAFACQGHPEPDPRDTQFVGFAQLLMQEIDEQIGAVTEWCIEHDIDSKEAIGQELYSRWQTLIAHRAYDLVSHVLNNTGPYMIDCLSHEEQIAEIPDMTAWPEEAK